MNRKDYQKEYKLKRRAEKLGIDYIPTSYEKVKTCHSGYKFFYIQTDFFSRIFSCSLGKTMKLIQNLEKTDFFRDDQLIVEKCEKKSIQLNRKEDY